SQLSRSLDKKKDLGDYVRLSFSAHHPMMYVALSEGRLLYPVVLQVSLDVVSRPGTLFSDRNAASSSAIVCGNQSVIRFNIVRKPNQFTVSSADRCFFQAEVLIPSEIGPEFIRFPFNPSLLPPPLSSQLPTPPPPPSSQLPTPSPPPPS